jgi:hypothetical protein
MVAAPAVAEDRVTVAAHARYKKRWHSSVGKVHPIVHVAVPDDVQRFEGVPEPCFLCGAARGCRHKPWMLGR